MNPERDLPQGTAQDAPVTFEDQVQGIADILEDPATDLQETEGHDAADDAPEAEADADIINAEDVEEESAEPGNGPDDPAYKAGRFAADDAKVRLDDGSTITIGELKRNNLYQRDYTGKTTALAEERKQFDARKSEVDQQAQSLEQALNYVTWYAQNAMPKEPTPPATQDDYVGWINYQRDKDAFDRHQQSLTWFQQQTQAMSQQKQREGDQQRRDRAAKEMDTLASKDALFRDPKKAKAWFSRAQELGAEYYGLTPNDLGAAILNHGYLLALRDAFRYRSQKAKAATVKDEVRRPAIAPGGRRQDPSAQVNRQRQARSEQLRKSGTFENGVAALMDLDL